MTAPLVPSRHRYTPALRALPPAARLTDEQLMAEAEALAAADPTAGKNPRWAHDPVGWTERRLGERPWSKQRAILESVRDHPRTAVRSCHSSGKSWTAARTVGWWLDVHPIGQAFAITTAPTASQVKSILWREIGALHRKASLPGRTNLTEWYIGPELVAFGRKSADTDPDAFQGIHARYLLVVIDEANGVAPALWDAADTLATNRNARILVIGNPDSSGSRFAKVCKPGSGWHRIKIAAWDTPNFTREEVPEVVAENLLDPEWVNRKRREWGTDHPYWQSKVLAEFPQTDEALVISPASVDTAHVVDLPADGRRILAVDVARFGADHTIYTLNIGGRVRIVDRMTTSRTTEVTGRAIQLAGDFAVDEIRVDADGIGAGVVDELVEAKQTEMVPVLLGVPIVELHSAAAPADPRKFLNARAEWWWHARDLIRDGQVDLDPDDEQTAAQLVDVKYGVDSRGRIFIESKADMRRAGRSSPDRADTVIYALAPVHVPPIPTEADDEDVDAYGDVLDEQAVGF